MKEYLSFCACYYTSQELWFSNNLYNGLFRYDFNEKKTEFIRTFPGMTWGRRGLHQRVVYYNHKLFFVPGNSLYIHIFSLENRNMELIELECVRDISEIHVNGNLLYIIPKFLGQPEVIFNLDTYEIVMNYDLNLICKKYRTEDGTKLFYRIYMDESIAWLPMLGSNVIIEYDYVDRKLINEYFVPIDNLNGIMKYNSFKWIINGDNCVYRWNTTQGSVKKYDLCNEELSVGALSLNVLNDRLYVFAMNTCDIFVYNEAEDKFDKWFLPVSEYFSVEHACSSWSRFSGGENGFENAIINQFATNAIVKIVQENEYEIIEIYTTEKQSDILARYKYECNMRRGKVHETGTFMFSDYIKGVLLT